MSSKDQMTCVISHGIGGSLEEAAKASEDFDQAEELKSQVQERTRA